MKGRGIFFDERQNDDGDDDHTQSTKRASRCFILSCTVTRIYFFPTFRREFPRKAIYTTRTHAVRRFACIGERRGVPELTRHTPHPLNLRAPPASTNDPASR